MATWNDGIKNVFWNGSRSLRTIRRSEFPNHETQQRLMKYSRLLPGPHGISYRILYTITTRFIILYIGQALSCLMLHEGFPRSEKRARERERGHARQARSQLGAYGGSRTSSVDSASTRNINREMPRQAATQTPVLRARTKLRRGNLMRLLWHINRKTILYNVIPQVWNILNRRQFPRNYANVEEEERVRDRCGGRHSSHPRVTRNNPLVTILCFLSQLFATFVSNQSTNYYLENFLNLFCFIYIVIVFIHSEKWIPEKWSRKNGLCL